MRSHRRHIAGAKFALGWAVIGFVCAQVALDVVVARRPKINDSEFAQRLKTLRARMAEEPGRPLLLLLGSSRTEMSFLPEVLPPLRTPNGETVLPFNFSHLGAGPAMNLLELHRVLRNGIRPDRLVVEIMPPQLGDAGQRILLSCAGVDDLSVTRRYRNPFLVYGHFLRGQLVPCYRHRQFLAHQAFREWVPAAEWDKTRCPLGALGGDYAWQAIPGADPASVQVSTASARAGYRPPLQDLQVTDLSNRAMHDVLDLCRQNHIEVALLLSPEGPEFQSWYSPVSRRRVDDYCSDLCREFRVPLIDARDWLQEEDFMDSHHVLLAGARKFSLRLGREALEPFVGGRLIPSQDVATGRQATTPLRTGILSGDVASARVHGIGPGR